MSVGSADLHTAIATAWSSGGLNVKFKALWNAAITSTQYKVLHDTEATPNQPFPYCVYSLEKPMTISRMSGSETIKHEIRDARVNFAVYADKVVGDARSVKQIAAYLIEEIMKVFGGHPTVSPAALTLTHGGHLITQYQNDYPQPSELYKYSWMVTYLIRIDVPVAI